MNVTICGVSPQTVGLVADSNAIKVFFTDNEYGNELRSLSLSQNQLSSVANLTSFTKLLYLDLSYNLLQTLDSQVFAQLQELNVLILHHNQLKEFITENQLVHLRYLPGVCK